MPSTQLEETTSLVCQLDEGVFSIRQRKRHEELRQQIQSSKQEVRELPEGYALRFPADFQLLLTLAEFIALERACCPFFRFTLGVEPEGGPIWLELTGGVAIKQFLSEELGLKSECG